MHKIFIDGSAGTTGLRIFDRLSRRDDIELITLSDADRKNPSKRTEALNEADIAFLCLPDAAAEEAVGFLKNENTCLIDASTAHRTSPEWVYGFPELDSAFEEKIKSSKRIAVPGCHASGFIALVYPLLKNGFISSDALLTCHSLTGYSGGGKKMIEQYALEKENPIFNAPRQYGISQLHKHLKEMTAISGLENAPAFCPIVADFYSGMEVTVPIFSSQLTGGKTVDDIKELYAGIYSKNRIVRYSEGSDEDGFLSAAKLSGTDAMEISVFGNLDRILLTARYDNLGKGASGAAIECMNLVMNKLPETGLLL